MKSGKFLNRQQLQRCAEFGTPHICFYSGFPEPHVEQREALPLVVRIGENMNGVQNLTEKSLKNRPKSGSFDVGTGFAKHSAERKEQTKMTLPPKATIDGLFGQKIRFRVPSYQRAYSWQTGTGVNDQVG